MAQIIRIKRRIGNATPPTAAQVTEGELAYHRATAAGAAAAADNLWIGDGTGAHLLVGAARQLEVAGAQTVLGLKTFAVTDTPANNTLSITGGAGGNVLTTNGGGQLSWAATPPATVQVVPPVSGDGAGTPLGVTSASTAQIIAGTDLVFPINSAGLRNQMGEAANAQNMETTAPTVVPAIREHSRLIAALQGALNLVGAFDASSTEITDAVPPAQNGGLPAAAAGNNGWLLITTVAGTAVAPAPPGDFAVGDWLVSTGVEWLHLRMNMGVIAAINVSFAPIAAGGGLPGVAGPNVQLAINQVYTQTHNRAVVIDTSLTGSGIIGAPLSVALVDAETF